MESVRSSETEPSEAEAIIKAAFGSGIPIQNEFARRKTDGIIDGITSGLAQILASPLHARQNVLDDEVNSKSGNVGEGSGSR